MRRLVCMQRRGRDRGGHVASAGRRSGGAVHTAARPGMVPTWASSWRRSGRTARTARRTAPGLYQPRRADEDDEHDVHDLLAPSNWSQHFPSGYSTLVNRYFGDVAATAGRRRNVYYTETQYSGIRYKSTFAGTTTDTDPLPASGCSDSAAQVCVSDAQLASEVSNSVSAHGLPRNSTTEYFVYFAPGVGSCLGSVGCAFVDYCAYHNSSGTGSGALIYANMPYVENVSGCDAGHHPNSLPGDATIT